MTATLSVTSKGQITLKRAVLEHLGVRPGQKVELNLLPGGRVELLSPGDEPDIRAAFGILHRPGQRPATLEEMQEAIEASAAGE